MLDRFHFIFFFLFLIQCAGPQTAVLGPVLTGAKTGIIYQTSLSYGSNRIMDELDITKRLKLNNLKEKRFLRNNNPILPDIPYSINDPVILVAYAVNKIEISSVIEPEPLP